MASVHCSHPLMASGGRGLLSPQKMASSLKSVGDQDAKEGFLALRPILLFGPAEPSFRLGRTL